MKLTNQQIYNYAQNLRAFSVDIKLPVRINFFLQKNIQTIVQAAEEIEQARFNIGAQYGTPNETGNGYDIPNENIEIVNQELNDLFAIEQELNIYIFNLEQFDNIELTFQELSAIMFMIEE